LYELYKTDPPTIFINKKKRLYYTVNGKSQLINNADPEKCLKNTVTEVTNECRQSAVVDFTQ
jgi:hypothetical protein